MRPSMMDAKKITDWLQVIANLGIVGGLVLVALQMNQTAEISRQDLRARNYEMNMGQQFSMFGESASDAWQKAFFSPESMSAEELTVVYYILDHRRDLHSLVSSHSEGPNEISVDWEASLRWHAHNTYGANEISLMWWNAFDHSEEAWSRYVNEIIEKESESSELEKMRHNYCETYAANPICE